MINSNLLPIILNNLTMNIFNPAQDNASKLPDSPGIYFICLKKEANLPSRCGEIIYTEHNNSRIIYIGIAGQKNTKRKSLRKRYYHDHFESNNAGKSTLRKSLGVLFRYKQIPRDKDLSTGKTKFTDDNERKLSEWMKQSLFLYYTVNDEPWEFEYDLINKFNPPLNLKRKQNPINAEFRKKLSRLRRKKIKE